MKNSPLLRAASLILTLLLFGASLLSHLAVRADGGRALTLYVDGSSYPTGHVFLSLSDNSGTKFYGFHSIRKALAPARMGSGEVRDDSGEKWEVRKEYPLTNRQYQQAVSAVQEWKHQNKPWWFNHHCGDFAQTIAQSAGIALSLPWTSTGYNRPGLFAHYLKQHGGEPNLIGTTAGGAPAELPSTLRPLLSAAGLWRISGSRTGKTVRIDQTPDGYAVREGTPFLLTGPGRILTGDHVYSLAELQKKSAVPIPANVQRNLEGKVKSHLTLTLSEDGQTAVYFFEGMGWRANPKTGSVTTHPTMHSQTIRLARVSAP